MTKTNQKAESEGGWKQCVTCALECQTGHTRPQVQSCGTPGPESWPLISPHLFCLLQAGQQNRGLGPSSYFSAVSQPSIPKPSSSIFPWRNGHCPEEPGLPECPGGLSDKPTEIISALELLSNIFQALQEYYSEKMIKTNLDRSVFKCIMLTRGLGFFCFCFVNLAQARGI